MTQTIHSFADAERLARRRLPRAMFDSIVSGAGKELTLRANLAAFDEVGFQPKAAVRHPSYDLSTQILGLGVASPIMIAPTGSNRMFRREGEPELARTAGKIGAAYVTSCLSGYPLDQVLAQAKAPVFFNLYTIGGRDTTEAMIAQARAAGCRALVLTIDMMGTHGVERDHGLRPRAPLGLNVATAMQYASQLVTKPAWTFDFMRDGMRFDCPLWIKPDGSTASFGDVLIAFGGGDVCATWEDIAWIREAWRGPIVLKGILRSDDALRAIDAGAQAIVVSNHAARNVDGSPATLSVLPPIVDAVGDQIEVWFDGGIRRGTDVVKALAIGAKAVLIGRAYLLAFAAAGGPGVQRIYEILHGEINATLRSLGCRSVRDLERSYLSLPDAWGAKLP